MTVLIASCGFHVNNRTGRVRSRKQLMLRCLRLSCSWAWAILEILSASFALQRNTLIIGICATALAGRRDHHEAKEMKFCYKHCLLSGPTDLTQALGDCVAYAGCYQRTQVIRSRIEAALIGLLCICMTSTLSLACDAIHMHLRFQIQIQVLLSYQEHPSSLNRSWLKHVRRNKNS